MRDRPCESPACKRSRPEVDGELLRQIHQPLLLYEAVVSHLLVPLRHAGDGILEVVEVILQGALCLGIVQADTLPWRPCQAADRLQHGVEDRPGEVLLRVRQAARIVGAGSAAQGQEPLALQVRDVQAPLPGGPVLDEVSGHLRDHLGVVSDELLLPFGEP